MLEPSLELRLGPHATGWVEARPDPDAESIRVLTHRLGSPIFAVLRVPAMAQPPELLELLAPLRLALLFGAGVFVIGMATRRPRA